MADTIRSRYGICTEIVRPDAAEIEAMVSLHGRDLFRESVPFRMLCCELRKVRPLEKFLQGVDAWAVGLRREQSETRANVPKVLSENGRVKIAPLAGWTAQQVADYVQEHNVPRHPLYDRGYTSIGCDPCTRAVAPGEHERAGRWWWEQDADKECGIHFSADGKVKRTVDVLLEEVLALRHA
jgi:phosphoadenylyl-sulfate reductase (thioredoxin)